MFILNNKVKVVDNRVIVYQNYSTPGVYKIFNVNRNTKYRIILEGYEGLINTKLWIADMNNRKIYFKNISNMDIIYHNFNYNRIKVGVLFSGNFKIGDYYKLQDIKIIENLKNTNSNININNNEINELKMYQDIYYNIKSKIIQNNNKIIENDNKIIQNDNKIIQNDNKIIENDNKIIENDNKIIEETKLFTNVLVKDKIVIQLCTAYNIKYFDSYAKRKYHLTSYYDKTKPVIFYGCYTNSDLRRIKNHTGHKVLIWGGSDIMNKSIISSVFRIKNLKHIAQSSFIKKDLKRNHQKYIYLPFAPTVNYNFYSPVKKGSCIYVYTNACNQEFYGSKIYYKLIRQFPRINFIIATNVSSYYEAKRRGLNYKYLQTFNPCDMHRVYNKCFIGLRLTKHDGISATVQELGMLGIKTIHNGKTPNCINYNTYEDIVKIIKEEYENIGKIDEKVSCDTRDHLKICDDLLPYLFDTITIGSEIYVMINYNKWQSYKSYIKRKKNIWVMYNNNGDKIRRNNDISSYVLPTEGWY